ncbi:MAG TPA: DUF721 domain-containing protein [Pyrinomonadaceae bacterium]|jgi:predicted nucleic acid-binding Zn ribbon protein
MNRLIDSLPAILKASGGGEEIAEAACLAAWKHAVGEALSSHAVPVQLRQQTLIVAVADNIWKRQLEQMCGQLLFRLNSVLGQSLVELIELRIDPTTVDRARAAQTASSRRAPVDYSVPPDLLRAAAAIEDAELRRVFLGAAGSCVKRLENPQSEIRNPKF